MGGGYDPQPWNKDKLDKGTRALIPTPTPGPTKAKPWYGNAPTGKTDPNALIPLDKLISYVEEVEKAYPKDTASDILTRIRMLYYNGIAFEQLIPGAHVYDIQRVVLRGGAGVVMIPRIVSQGLISAEAYDHLTARADENALGDNPSPYVVLPGGDRFDLGHLLLTVDALLHPGTSIPYTTYNVPNIDPASWVADVGIAAVWMEVHEKTGKPHDDVVNPPATADKDVYWRMSAPTEDILGDADGFGLFRLWGKDVKLSQLLRAYYGGGDPDKSVKKRYQIFCAAEGLTYTRNGKSITWDAALKPKLITRIDTFNNLYADGKVGSAAAAILPGVKPSTGSWKYTPYMLDKFLDWVKVGVEKELAGGP
jgi:hypothetical protein